MTASRTYLSILRGVLQWSTSSFTHIAPSYAWRSFVSQPAIRLSRYSVTAFWVWLLLI